MVDEIEEVFQLRLQVEEKCGPIHPFLENLPLPLQRDFLIESLEKGLIVSEREISAVLSDIPMRIEIVKALSVLIVS